jgi:tetratricopeptide (TPR) repeat protein
MLGLFIFLAAPVLLAGAAFFYLTVASNWQTTSPVVQQNYAGPPPGQRPPPPPPALPQGPLVLPPELKRGGRDTVLAGADLIPIPQDLDRQNRRFDETLAWNKQTLLGAYEKVGKKDPRWDEPARAAMEKAARHFSVAVDPFTELSEVHAAAKKAVEAGCDDPLVLYLYARSSHQVEGLGGDDLQRRYLAAATALEGSNYPAVRRQTALYNAGYLLATNVKQTPQTRKEATRLLDAALDLLPVSVREDERAPVLEEQWLAAILMVIDGHRYLTGDYKAAYDHVDAALEKIPELKALRLAVRGDFYIHFAWEARGNGFANTVTPEGARLFEERLIEARKSLEESWEVQPNGTAALLMLTVVKGLGNGNRNEMEKWFERAMTTGRADSHVCTAKLDWLDPKWRGSMESMLAFGRACRDTKNWRAGIPLLAAEAHYRAGNRIQQPEGQTMYFAQQEVWDDIREVHEEHLQHFPNDHWVRSNYACYAYLCGRYAESNEQFRLLGDQLQATDLFPDAWNVKTLAQLAEKAKPAAGGQPLQPPK